MSTVYQAMPAAWFLTGDLHNLIMVLLRLYHFRGELEGKQERTRTCTLDFVSYCSVCDCWNFDDRQCDETEQTDEQDCQCRLLVILVEFIGSLVISIEMV